MSAQMMKTAMTMGANGVPVEVIEAPEGAGDVTTVLPPGLAGLVSDEFIAELADEAVVKARNGEFRLTGGDGFLQSLIKAVLERGLAAELSDHLGYGKHDPAGRNGGNSRNGTTPKDDEQRARQGRVGGAAGPGGHVRPVAGAQGQHAHRRRLVGAWSSACMPVG